MLNYQDPAVSICYCSELIANKGARDYPKSFQMVPKRRWALKRHMALETRSEKFCLHCAAHARSKHGDQSIISRQCCEPVRGESSEGCDAKTRNLDPSRGPVAGINFWYLLARILWHSSTCWRSVTGKLAITGSGVDNRFCPNLPASVPDLTGDLDCCASEWGEWKQGIFWNHSSSPLENDGGLTWHCFLPWLETNTMVSSTFEEFSGYFVFVKKGCSRLIKTGIRWKNAVTQP